jgi:DNA modification methylase
MASPLNKTIRLTSLELQREVEHFPTLLATIPRSNIYQGDAIEGLRTLPENSIRLLIADPPYNFGRDFGNESDKQSESDYKKWMRAWISEIVRPSTLDASFYICCDWYHSGLVQTLLEDAGLSIRNRITWKREKGRGASANWKQNMEDIWFAVRDAKNYVFNIDAVKVRKKVIAPYRKDGEAKDWITTNEGERIRMTYPSNIWTDLTVPFWSMPENTEHPTQKPEALVERLILASSNAGDRVLDLFSGSGTTSVVAKKLGREFIGIELNPDFVRLGLKRIERLDEDLRLI